MSRIGNFTETVGEPNKKKTKRNSFLYLVINFKFINWITIKLMKYQAIKAEKQKLKQEYSFMKRAFSDMEKNYKSTIMFLEANNK